MGWSQKDNLSYLSHPARIFTCHNSTIFLLFAENIPNSGMQIVVVKRQH